MKTLKLKGILSAAGFFLLSSTFAQVDTAKSAPATPLNSDTTVQASPSVTDTSSRQSNAQASPSVTDTTSSHEANSSTMDHSTMDNSSVNNSSTNTWDSTGAQDKAAKKMRKAAKKEAKADKKEPGS